MIEWVYVPLDARAVDEFIPDVEAFAIAVEAEILAEAEELLDGTVENWDEPPEFKTQFYSTFDIEFGYDDIRWTWIDLGTEPHTITAKDAPNLRFLSGYTPRTNPGSLKSGQSGRFPPYVSKFSVNHPGVEARDFSSQIKEQLDIKLAALVISYTQRDNSFWRNAARRIFRWRR